MSRLWINTMEVKQPNNGHLAGAQLFKYAMEGENDKVREMMTTGGLLASDTVGTTALHCAVIGNQLETCELFLQAGVSVDVKTKVDRTPLHFAVFHGHERMVKLLLSKSCEVDPVDMLQMTPLHWAVEKNHVNIARLLLESGASPYSVSKFGKTPKGMAEERDNPSLRRLFSKYDWSETKPKQDEDPRDMVDYALQEDAGSDIENISVFEEDLDEVEVIPAPEMETEEIESANGDVEDVAAAGRLVAHDSDDSFTNLQEAIEKLGDVKEIKPSDPTTLKILQKIGLQITDEHDPSMLTNVLQSGRRIVLSEAGKYILNKTKNNERLDLPDSGSKKQNVPTVPNSTQPPINKRIRTRESLRADPSSLVKRSRISESERMGTRNKSAADLRELTEEQPPVNGDSATEHEIVDLDEVEEEPEQEHIDLEQVPLQRVQKLEKMVLLLQRDNKELRSMLELSIRQMEESQKRIERLEGKVLKRKED